MEMIVDLQKIRCNVKKLKDICHVITEGRSEAGEADEEGAERRRRQSSNFGGKQSGSNLS
jgi:hypothetical protein